jgi:hypothetical protein
MLKYLISFITVAGFLTTVVGMGEAWRVFFYFEIGRKKQALVPLNSSKHPNMINIQRLSIILRHS